MRLFQRKHFLIFITAFCPFPLLSQAQSTVVKPAAEQLGTDTNVVKAGPNEFIIINGIGVIGNKTTKSHIILRELPFSVNDTIARADMEAKLKSAKENILNTSLFNFVRVDTITSANERVNVLISVAERSELLVRLAHSQTDICDAEFISALTGEGIAGLVSAISGKLVPVSVPAGSAVPFTGEEIDRLAAAREAVEHRDAPAAADLLQALLT